jgi:hypothetical protein
MAREKLIIWKNYAKGGISGGEPIKILKPNKSLEAGS